MTQLTQILRNHGVWTYAEFEQHVEDGDAELSDALYQHFLASGEMPYDVAKARGGDPNNWIYERVVEYLGG